MRGGLALLAAAALAVGCANGSPLAGYARPGHTGPAFPGPAGGSAPTGTAGATAAPSAAGAARPADPLAGRELITVTSASSGATYATLTAYRRSAGHWRRVLGPWTARIGRNGFAPPGRKREGDGRTRRERFGFGFFFGIQPNPGVRFRYRQAQPYDYWDDDPASPRYNEWVNRRAAPVRAQPGADGRLRYDYGAVITYDTTRAPGLGSAIFLHVNIGIAAAAA